MIWSETARNDWKWSQMVRNSWKLSELVGNCQTSFLYFGFFLNIFGIMPKIQVSNYNIKKEREKN